MNSDPITVVRVGAQSEPHAVAGTLAKEARSRWAAGGTRHEPIPVDAIGGAAVLRAQQAIALAIGYVASNGLTLLVRPQFVDVPAGSDGSAQSGMRFMVHVREG